MRGAHLLRSSVAILSILVMGCATSQTVHWREDMAGAASRLADLSATRETTIVDMVGAEFRGRDVLLARDSVRWTRIPDGAPRAMPLADVASIEVVAGRHGKDGALVGSLIGATAVLLEIKRSCACSGLDTILFMVYYGIPGAAVGALVGALVGTSKTDKIIFIPEDF